MMAIFLWVDSENQMSRGKLCWMLSYVEGINYVHHVVTERLTHRELSER